MKARGIQWSDPKDRSVRIEANRDFGVMRLSVIIPCLNSADTIGFQLEALANQDWALNLGRSLSMTMDRLTSPVPS